MFRIFHPAYVISVVIALTLPVAAQESNAPLTIARQGSFFIGGRDVHSETLSTVPTVAPVGTVTVEQMYVRYQLPVDAKLPPITLIHGNFLSGATWETTPDGRMGWDEYFLRKGHGVYIVDQVARARSAPNLSVITAAKLGKAPPDQLPAALYAGHEAAWTIFRFGTEYPKAFPGLQYPLEAVGELWKQMLPDWSSSLPAPNP